MADSTLHGPGAAFGRIAGAVPVNDMALTEDRRVRLIPDFLAIATATLRQQAPRATAAAGGG